MTLRRLAAIAGDTILPLADAKAHLRVTHDAEDDLIASLRNAACEYVERMSGVALAPSQYLWEGAGFLRVAGLPLRPVVSIDDVEYLDADGATQNYTTARIVNGYAAPAAGDTWPTSYGYAAITFTAGDTCPPDLLSAVKLMLGHLYENRAATESGNVIPRSVPFGVDALIQTYRMVRV